MNDNPRTAREKRLAAQLKAANERTDRVLARLSSHLRTAYGDRFAGYIGDVPVIVDDDMPGDLMYAVGEVTT